MDPSTFVLILISVILPFVLSTIKNPASIAKLKKYLPALRTVYAALGQLIDAIDGKVTVTTLSKHAVALRKHLKRHTF